jgi:hypothetical protein
MEARFNYMKKLSFLLLSSSIFLSLTTKAASRNLCDDLIDNGASPEQIKKCQDKLGISEYAKEKEKKDALKKDKDAIKDESTAKKKDNIEIKKFTEADLVEAGFGKPFYAIKVDYRQHRRKEERITKGDALCIYLGFEKAIKSIVSPEIMPNDADKNGLVVDTSWLGNHDKEPQMYRDEDLMFTVRKYKEITCAKRKDKALDEENEMLKLVSEDLVVINEILGGPKDKDDSQVDNSKRSDGKSTFSPKIPDWAKDDTSNKAKSK